MKILRVILISLLIGGCATPGVKFEDKGDIIEITSTEADEGLLSWLFGSGLKAGDYECQFGEHKKAKFSTKQDMKLLNLDMNAVKGD